MARGGSRTPLTRSQSYGPFRGVDKRRHPASMDQNSFWRATNVSLLPGGAIETRPGLRKVCSVSSNSVGLYSSGGYLRAVVPGGQALQDIRPPDVFYDPIGDGTLYDIDSLKRLCAVEEIGSAEVAGAAPYVVVERQNGSIEHHWLTAAPALSTDLVSTRVSLPFDPGKALLKSNNKLFAPDPANGVLRFCATASPSDWRASRDAGFLAVRQYISGARDITALGYYRGGLVAVMFADAIELWQMDPDPTKFNLVSVLNGPGTEAHGAVNNVLGDAIYFSRGGFRSLASATVTGQANETDVGSFIEEDTKTIDLATVEPVSVWSQTRSQYLCAFGKTVWVYTNSPVAKRYGWARWDLPVAVDYLVEHEGDLYIRSGTDVYMLDPDQEKDFGTTDITFDVLPAFLSGGAQGPKKFWKFVDLVQTGTSDMYFHTDTSDVDATENSVGIRTTGPTYVGGLIGVNLISDTLAVGFKGTGKWRLDAYTLHYTMLGMT